MTNEAAEGIITKKSGITDNDRISAAIILCVISFTVILTAGFIAEKQRVPAEDIVIEAVVAETERNGEWDGLWEETTAAAASAPEAEFAANEDTVNAVTATEEETAAENALININTATVSELETLPGIGEKTAQAIIGYRENTPFQRIEDIMNVSGIGEKKFEDIKDMICV